MGAWELVEDGIHRFRDSCNVYAVMGSAGGWFVCNAGTGAAAAHLAELGATGDITVVLTHHFRDHSAGVPAFRQAGARIAAPHWEREHLAAGQRAARSKQTYLLYDLAWDHFAPVEPLLIDRWLMDYERIEIAGLTVEVIPAPGATLGAATYVVTLPNRRRLAFIGELMGEPGRLPRLAPLQYDYNDLLGVENTLHSWTRVLASGPDLALPSLGEPFGHCADAVERLRRNLAPFDLIHPGFATRIAKAADAGVEEVLPRLFRSRTSSAETHFIVSRTGRVLALDFGYDTGGIRFPQRCDYWNRRTLLHSLPGLREKAGVDRIDTVLVSHYHDDHVAGVPLLQRLFGTELWAGENFADLLENPECHDRPCLWPDSMPVHRRLTLGRPILWEDVTITLHAMSGHTEFSTLICLEFDGHRVAHTGDQLFYLDPKTNRLTPPGGNSGIFTNHVYRNGLALGGYGDCVRRLKAFDPQLILSGHSPPYRPEPELWPRLEQAAQAFDDVHRALLPLGESDTHFGADSLAAKLQPYHLRLPAGATEIELHGWVLNPHDRPARAELAFVTPPPGWSAEPVIIRLRPRTKEAFSTKLSVPAGIQSTRQPIALDLRVDGRAFGQVAEAWVTVGD